ncbi:MAG TPA: chemotaxis protein CheW [Polyangiaceae bacterium]
MNARFDLSEYLTAYLGEVEEHLRVANEKLLLVEASARDGKTNPRAVRDLFRALHTIKGLSAMVGVDSAVTLAHKMESIVRTADRSDGRLSVDVITTLLEGTRAIERCARELGEKKEPSPPPPSLLEALDRIEPSSALAPVEKQRDLDLDPAILAKLAPFEVAQLIDGAHQGKRALRADFSPSPEKAARGFSINSVRERLSSVAEVVKVVPRSVAPSKDAPGALTFAILMVSSASNDELAAAVDIDPSHVHELARSEPVASAEAASEVVAEFDDDELSVPRRRNVVRVDVARLDDAMDHLAALVVTRSRLTRAIAALTAQGVSTRELGEIMRENARQLRDLRGAILRVRMVPVADILDRIPLLVRGASSERGKIVRIALDTGSAELDKGVAERLFPALVHLVRNAVDHAFETPEERTRAGKPEAGTLRIGCSAVSNAQLALTISDDGRGVDRAALSQKVGHALVSDADVLDALCLPGVSTSRELTTTSGRGMGMDIVKRIVVDQLGGDLSLATTPGIGSTFVLRVPLTISIVDAFTVVCARQRFVVPIATVEEIIEIDSNKVRFGPLAAGARAKPTGLLERRNETMPLVDLASALRLGGEEVEARHAMVVRHRGDPIAFAFDRVLGQQETVVRPLLDPLVQAPGVSGATDLGDGKPTVVLDLVALGASLAREKGERAA